MASSKRQRQPSNVSKFESKPARGLVEKARKSIGVDRLRIGIIGFEPLVRLEPRTGILVEFAEKIARTLDLSPEYEMLSWETVEQQLQERLHLVLDPVALGRGALRIVSYGSLKTPYLAFHPRYSSTVRAFRRELEQGEQDEAIEVLRANGVYWTKGTIEALLGRQVFGLLPREELSGPDLVQNARRALENGFLLADEWTLALLRQAGVEYHQELMLSESFRVPVGIAIPVHLMELGRLIEAMLVDILPSLRSAIEPLGLSETIGNEVSITRGVGALVISDAIRLWDSRSGGPSRKESLGGGADEGGPPLGKIYRWLGATDYDLVDRGRRDVFPSDALVAIIFGGELDLLDKEAFGQAAAHARETLRIVLMNFVMETDADDVLIGYRGDFDLGLQAEIISNVPFSLRRAPEVFDTLYKECIALIKSGELDGDWGRFSVDGDSIHAVKKVLQK